MVETWKTVLGPENPSSLTGMDNLALTFWNQGRWMETEKLLVQVMEKSKTALGPEHPDTLTSMWNLSGTRIYAGILRPYLYFKLVFDSKTDIWVPHNAHPDTIAATADLKAWQKVHSVGWADGACFLL